MCYCCRPAVNVCFMCGANHHLSNAPLQEGLSKGELDPIQEENVRKMWSHVHGNILEVNPQALGIPGLGAPVQQMRTWMRENRPVLEGITRLVLDHLHLTCLPHETALFTSLQRLALNDN